LQHVNLRLSGNNCSLTSSITYGAGLMLPMITFVWCQSVRCISLCTLFVALTDT